MAAIRLVSDYITNCPSSSDTVKIEFATDEPIYTYRFDVDYNYDFDDYTTDTAAYMVEDDDDDLRYHYILYFNLRRNITSGRQLQWYCYVDWDGDSDFVNGLIRQTSNATASYIGAVGVYNKYGKILKRDYLNRWVIGPDYEDGDEFEIHYGMDYPSQVVEIPQCRLYDVIPTSFIASIQTIDGRTTRFTINDYMGDSTNILKLFYDDSGKIGKSETSVVLTREDATSQLPRITLSPSSNYDLAYTAGIYMAEITFTNIRQMDVQLETSADWIQVSYGLHPFKRTLVLNIRYDENEGNDKRFGNIKVYGTNTEGKYTEAYFYLSQVPRVRPYISDFFEYDGDRPVIRCYFDGEVKQDYDRFIIHNYHMVESIQVKYRTNTLDWFNITPIEGTNNALVEAKTKFFDNPSDEYEWNYGILFNITSKEGELISTNIKVMTDISPSIVSSPIWKDVFVSCNNKYFRLVNQDTNETMYVGQVYDEANNIIRVNDIVKSFFEIKENPFAENIFVNNKLINILFETSDNLYFNNYEILKVFHLFWDYTYNYNADDDNLFSDYTIGYYDEYAQNDTEDTSVNPITFYDPRQIVFINWATGITSYNGQGAHVIGVQDDGTTTNLMDIPSQYAVGDVITMAVRPEDYDEIRFRIDKRPQEIGNPNHTWRIGKSKCTKADYAVYYLNSAGLWCWMLFEGKQVESIKTTSDRYLNDRDNRISYNIHNKTYRTEIEDTYNLTSAHLTDIQSRKLKDLYTSPFIYVHELNNGTIYNVYMSTNTYDIKTRRNQGKKRFTHTVKLTKSLNKTILV